MYNQLKKEGQFSAPSFINFTESVYPKSANEFNNTYLFETVDPRTPVFKNKVSFNITSTWAFFILSSFHISSFNKPYHTLQRGKQYKFTSTESFHVSRSDRFREGFTIIITTLRGQANINEIYNDTEKTMNVSTLFNVHLLDKQMRLELNTTVWLEGMNKLITNFFFDFECVECAYQILWNDTYMQTKHTTLDREFTNYLLIQTGSYYYVHVNRDTQSKESYNYQVQINTLDCELDVYTKEIGAVIKHDYNRKVLAINDIPSDKDFVLRIEGTLVSKEHL